jgi:hypothetical protein
VERNDLTRWQASWRSEAAVGEDRQSAVGSDPNGTSPVLVNHFHVVARQSVLGCVVSQLAATKQKYPLLAAEPEAVVGCPRIEPVLSKRGRGEAVNRK